MRLPCRVILRTDITANGASELWFSRSCPPSLLRSGKAGNEVQGRTKQERYVRERVFLRSLEPPRVERLHCARTVSFQITRWSVCRRVELRRRRGRRAKSPGKHAVDAS
jgi:hypothetical protein